MFLSKVSPSEEFVDLFKRIVIDTYNDQHISLKQDRAHSERELARLGDCKKDLLEMRISHEISKEEYLEMKNAIESQINNVGRVAEEDSPDLKLETAVSSVSIFIKNVANEWNLMIPPRKQRLQKVVLPQGIIYHKSAGMFGTAVLSPIFKLYETFTAMPSGLVAGAGIAPTIFRL